MEIQPAKRPGQANAPRFNTYTNVQDLRAARDGGWKDASDDYLLEVTRRFETDPSNRYSLEYGFSQGAGQELARRRNEAAQKAEAEKFAPIPPPKRDPRIAALMKSQRDLAKRFREQMPGAIEGEYGEFQRDRSRALQGEREQIDASFNRRGLLNSGLRQGVSGDAGERATGDLITARQAIGQRYRDTADALDDEPLNLEIALAGGNAQIGQAVGQAQQEFQNLVIQNRMNRQNALESAFQSGGYFLGTALGLGSGGSNYAGAKDWVPGSNSADSYNPFYDYMYEGAF